MHTRVYAKMRMPLSLIFQEYILTVKFWDMEDNRKLHLFCIVYAFTAASRLMDRASALVRCKVK